MGIRNNKLGGTDWGEEGLRPTTDLNPTIDAVIDQNIPDAELAVRTLQSNNIFTNGPNLVVDEMTDSNGTINTINTGSSTTLYRGGISAYELGINIGTLEDSPAYNTGSSTSGTLSVSGTTKSKGIITEVNLKFTSSASAEVEIIKNGNRIAIRTGSTDSNGYVTISFQIGNYSDIFVNGDAFEIRARGYSGTGSLEYNGNSLRTYDGTNFSYTGVYVWGGNGPAFQFGTTIYDSSSVVIADTNTTTLDGNEKGFVISTPDSDFPTGTSITAKVSDGTNSLSAGTIDTISKGVVVGNPGTLSSGTLKLTFTLATSDTSVTPTLGSYGVKILR